MERYQIEQYLKQRLKFEASTVILVNSFSIARVLIGNQKKLALDFQLLLRLDLTANLITRIRG